MQIATWNINGVKARLETALAWLKEAKPDVACLQEIKSVDEAFPREPFEDLGYNVHTHGQKGLQRCGHPVAAPNGRCKRASAG
jgi:exodeoxyribonuclease-3